jgi:TPR repeat protein
MNGYSPAQRDLGVCLFYGHGAKKNIAKAIEWYQQAADKGDVMAQYNLGLVFLAGDGVPKNIPKARHWFQLAAKQGHGKSKRKLLEFTTPSR